MGTIHVFINDQGVQVGAYGYHPCRVFLPQLGAAHDVERLSGPNHNLVFIIHLLFIHVLFFALASNGHPHGKV